eukprot:3880088-Pleurochrysis_carterae.AAC.1
MKRANAEEVHVSILRKKMWKQILCIKLPKPALCGYESFYPGVSSTKKRPLRRVIKTFPLAGRPRLRVG